MIQPLELLQQIFVAPATELAMLGDIVEIEYGNSTLIGTVIEGDPWLDDAGQTWFRVEGTKLGYYGFLTVSSWVTDSYVVQIISKA
mgnify:CR=1 FL=1